MSKKVITFGEIMLRLMPEDGYRLLQNENLRATFGGGEANVAVSLANYGEDAAFVTALPDNAIGDAAIRDLRSFGVDTSMILRQGDRLGVYYVEKGASQRPSKVIYDRMNSGVTSCKTEDFDWNAIFKDAGYFHFTGITPALSPELFTACMEACRAARKMGVTVSCDLNYRKKLWTTEEARNAMSQLMPYVDICIANEEDADKVLGIRAEDTDVTAGKLSEEGYCRVAAEISARYHCKAVAITLRTSISASDNRWAGLLYCNGQCFLSRTYDVRLWDRVGGGDSFGGGLIYALHHNYEAQEAVEFAVAASCLKQTLQGDFNRVTVKEVKNLAEGDGSGRVVR